MNIKGIASTFFGCGSTLFVYKAYKQIGILSDPKAVEISIREFCKNSCFGSFNQCFSDCLAEKTSKLVLIPELMDTTQNYAYIATAIACMYFAYGIYSLCIDGCKKKTIIPLIAI